MISLVAGVSFVSPEKKSRNVIPSLKLKRRFGKSTINELCVAARAISSNRCANLTFNMLVVRRDKKAAR